VLERQTQSQSYWAETFKVTQADIDHLYGVLLDREEPLSTDEMALVLVRRHVHEESKQIEKQLETVELYRPDQTYEIGQELMFPALRFAKGTIVGQRDGESPEYGSFQAIEVEFPGGGPPREFASQLEKEHALIKSEPLGEDGDDDLLSAEELFIEYGGEVAEEIERSLANHEDIVRIAGSWFPKSLLAEVHIGHLNLAEAVLDMMGGGPTETSAILEQVELSASDNSRLQEFSMNWALQEDARFDEVGPAGQVLWYLRRMEPPEVQFTPPRLVYQPIEYDADLLTPDLRALEKDIQDELSLLRVERTRAETITVTLSFPHRRVGTLPLSARLRPFFPTAYEAPLIRFVLVDGQTGDEMPAWVVRTEGYVYGLDEWYNRNDIPAGAYIHVSRTDDTGYVKVDYARRRRPRSEWVRVASIQDNHLAFEMQQQTIGCDYDDLMIVTPEDPEAVDAYWMTATERGSSLEKIIPPIFRELARLTPQDNVHAKTLYSAVNLVRRCPPGPIFARLMTMPGFRHVGGAYWRLEAESEESSTEA
jgi:hypothetical protein